MESTRETCPYCGQMHRETERLLCRECNDRYNEKVAQAKRTGQVVVMNRMEYVFHFGQQMLARLEKELKETLPIRDRALVEAKKQLHRQLLSEGTITIDKTEWNRQCGKLFQEQVGGPDEAYRISDIVNNHEQRIDSLGSFLASISERLNGGADDEQDEQQAAAA